MDQRILPALQQLAAATPRSIPGCGRGCVLELGLNLSCSVRSRGTPACLTFDLLLCPSCQVSR